MSSGEFFFYMVDCTQYCKFQLKRGFVLLKKKSKIPSDVVSISLVLDEVNLATMLQHHAVVCMSTTIHRWKTGHVIYQRKCDLLLPVTTVC